jgi:hypothetical protein
MSSTLNAVDSYALPGLTLCLFGDKSPSTEIMAELLSQWGEITAHTDTGITVVVRSFSADQWGIRLPEWLRLRISQIRPTDDENSPAHMFYGPTDIWAVLVRHQEYHVAFWDHQKFLIEYHSYSDKKPPIFFARAFILALMKPLLREVLATKGHYLLHAAAVISEGNIGALLVGQGGAGKTTTALSFVRLGGKIISDDTVTLTSQEGRVVAHRSLKAFSVSQKTVEFFKELSPKFSAKEISVASDLLPDPRLGTREEVIPLGKKIIFEKKVISLEKKIIDWSDLVYIYGSNCLAESCPVDVIYLPRLTSGPPETFEVPVAEAVAMMTAAHIFARGQRLTRGAAELLTGLVDRTRIFILHTGSDPDLAGQWLKDHMGQIATSSSRV